MPYSCRSKTSLQRNAGDASISRLTPLNHIRELLGTHNIVAGVERSVGFHIHFIDAPAPQEYRGHILALHYTARGILIGSLPAPILDIEQVLAQEHDKTDESYCNRCVYQISNLYKNGLTFIWISLQKSISLCKKIHYLNHRLFLCKTLNLNTLGKAVCFHCSYPYHTQIHHPTIANIHYLGVCVNNLEHP